jgi:hypothetical protein
VLALGACIYIYEELFATGGSTPSLTPAAEVVRVPASPTGNAGAAVSGKAAKAIGTSAALDPTLHMEAMLVSESVEYTGNGRNIFSANSAPAVIPQAIAAARPKPGPVAPPPPPPVPCPPNCPPPPPPSPVPLKYFGVETASNGARQAFLLHEDDVYMAAAGDIVMRRYRVVAVDPRSIQIQDMQNNNTQTLPLLADLP